MNANTHPLVSHINNISMNTTVNDNAGPQRPQGNTNTQRPQGNTNSKRLKIPIAVPYAPAPKDGEYTFPTVNNPFASHVGLTKENLEVYKKAPLDAGILTNAKKQSNGKKVTSNNNNSRTTKTIGMMPKQVQNLKNSVPAF